jgi:transcriptional regulator with PAS, ATPase and Fis domain
MQLEFKRIDEANGLLNQLIGHHPHAIFLADHNFKIKYFNKSFQNFTKREKSEILDHEFCEIVGCSVRAKVIAHGDDFCKICQMRELLSGSNLSELELIRDFYVHNKIITKHLHIDAHRVVMQGHKYRLVVIEDRTQNH